MSRRAPTHFDRGKLAKMRRHLLSPLALGFGFVLVLVLVFGLGGCSLWPNDVGTALFIRAEVPGADELNQLEFHGTGDRGHAFSTPLLPSTPNPDLVGEQSVRVLLKDDWGGETFTVVADGFRGANKVISASGQVEIQKGHEVQLTIDLSAGVLTTSSTSSTSTTSTTSTGTSTGSTVTSTSTTGSTGNTGSTGTTSNTTNTSSTGSTGAPVQFGDGGIYSAGYGTQAVALVTGYAGATIPSVLTLDGYLNDPQASLFYGNGDGTFSQAYPSPIDYPIQGPYAFLFGKLGDSSFASLLELTANVNAAVDVFTYLGPFSPAFDNNPSFYDGAPDPRMGVLVDVNRDGYLDLLVANVQHSASVELLLGHQDGSLSSPVNVGGVDGAVALGWADFNNDGQVDLVLVTDDLNRAEVLLGNGDGTFQAPSGVTTLSGTSDAQTALVVGDIDGDTIPDVLVANGNTDQLNVLLSDGAGGFKSVADYTITSGTSALQLCDLNHDGAPDVVYGSLLTQGEVSYLINQGHGTFGDSQPLLLTSGTPSLACGRLNSDGLDDLVVGDSGNPPNTSGTVLVLLGQ
jgi:hypothetical protein